MTKPWVAVLMGSVSDKEKVAPCFQILKQLGVYVEGRVLSAHRTPEELLAYLEDAEKRGCSMFITAAGMAAHLGGVVAAHTQKPVVGIPLSASLDGLDALLSMVQMPGGIPVACMGLDKAGARNAALFAVQVLSLSDSELAARHADYRIQAKKKCSEGNEALQTFIGEMDD